MKHFLILLIVSCPFLGLFSMQIAAEDSEIPKYSDEQLQKLKAAEEKYKDDPKVVELISNIKANSGITDTVEIDKESGPQPVMAHGKVITEGSYQDADMETTIANYRIMAEEGDTEAAYAAYKQAAESGDDNEAKKIALERIKWLEDNGQVNQSEEGSSGASMAKQSHEVQYRSVTPSLATETSIPARSAVYSQAMNPNTRKLVVGLTSNHFLRR